MRPRTAPARSERAARALALLIAALAVALPARATEPLVRLRRNGGELGAWIESQSIRESARRRADPPRSQLWLRVPLEGAVVSSRLLSWSGAFRPSFQRGPAGEGGRVDVRETGFEVSARAFSGSPLTLAAVMARSRGQSQRDGASLAEFRSEVSSLSGALKLRGLTLQAELGDRRSDQSWVVAPLATTLEQDIRVRSWRVEAVNSKLQAWRQRERRTGPGEGSEYLTYASGAAHALRWGHGSELASRLTRDEQSRPAATGQWDWEERVRLRHTRRVESTWTREERHSWNSTGDARALGYGVRGSHQVADGVRYGLAYHERRATAAGEHSITRTGGPELAYSGLWGGRVRADVSAGLDLEQRRLRGEARGPVSVLDERALFDASGSVLLLRAGVSAASLRVESPDHTLLYVENVDYRLVAAASTLQILLLPGGRLRSGDAVLLSYAYDPPESGDADATSLRLATTFGWRNVTLRHSRRRRDADGSGIAVTARTSAFDEDESALEWDGMSRAGRVRVSGAVTNRRFEGVHQQVREVRAEWSAPATAYGQASVMAGHSRRTGERSPLDLDDLSLGWNATLVTNLMTTLRFEVRRSRFDSQPLESTSGVTLDAGYRFGAIDAALRYGFAARRDGIDRDAQRVWFRLSRRF